MSKDSPQSKHRQLILMRHAEAASAGGIGGTGGDHERPLTPAGRHDTLRMVRWLKGQGITPERILHSTAQRTTETAYLISDTLGLNESQLHPDRRLYLAEPDTILKALAQQPADLQSLLLIAHNPGLHTLLTQLAGPAARATGFPTATMALLQTISPDWHLGNTPLQLQHLMSPNGLPD